MIHYLNAFKLNAFKAARSTDAVKTIAWMKQNSANYFGQKARVRKGGRVLFDLELHEVKFRRSPSTRATTIGRSAC